MLVSHRVRKVERRFLILREIFFFIFFILLTKRERDLTLNKTRFNIGFLFGDGGFEML